jgi:hypothetical protein
MPATEHKFHDGILLFFELDRLKVLTLKNLCIILRIHFSNLSCEAVYNSMTSAIQSTQDVIRFCAAKLLKEGFRTLCSAHTEKAIRR